MQNVVSLCKYKHPKQKSSRVLTGYLVPLASVCILLTAFNPGAGIVPISGNLTPVCRWHSTSDHSKSRNRSERREIRKYKQELNNKTSMHGMGKLTQNSDARARLVENPPSLGHPHDVLTVRPPCFYGFIFSINCNTVQERWREPASLFSWCWPNCKETHLKRKKNDCQATQGSQATWQVQLYLEAATQWEENTEAGGLWVSPSSKTPAVLIEHKGAEKSSSDPWSLSQGHQMLSDETLLWREDGCAN